MKVEKIVPVLRINNRRVNQMFFEENLGLKTVLEEGAFVELAGHLGDKTAKLVLMESPSMRTRAVEGMKKHKRTVLRVENPAEIESLLARGTIFIQLYQGKKGFAFESVSPEGDRFLVHADKTVSDLREILPPTSFTISPDFTGLTDFVVSEIDLHTSEVAATQAFYQTILPNQDVLRFHEAQGPDLLCEAGETWDLDSLRITVTADMTWEQLEEQLISDYFKDKKETFLQTIDPNKIELWFEK